MQGKRTFKLTLSEDEMNSLLAILAYASGNVYWGELSDAQHKLVKLKAGKFWSVLASICDGEGELE